jgi:Cof subfamily protein (haloacid dehalogenase superfamily)
MIISDLDGTLLRSDETVSKESIDFINNLEIPFAVATGRILGDVKKFLAGAKFKYVMAANGSIIYDMEEDKMIYEKCISKENAEKYYNIVKDNAYKAYASMIDDWLQIEEGQNFDELGNIYKMSAFFNTEEEYREIEEEILALGLKTFFMEDPYTDGYYMEVVETGSSKKAAIEYMLKDFGVELKDIVAFGDSKNDLEMLEAVGHGVAMKNASEDAKEIADDIASKTNDEDGVIAYIKEKLGEKLYV